MYSFEHDLPFYNDEINRIMDELHKIFCDYQIRAEFKYQLQRKNNDIQKNTIVMRENDSDIGICVHIDEYLEEINHNKMTEHDAALKIVDTFLLHRDDRVELPKFTIDEANEKLYAAVINAKANKEMLEKVPHQIVAGDLALIPRYRIDDNKSILVTNEMGSMLCMTPSEIISTAIRNTQKSESYSIRTMQDELRSISSEFSDEELEKMIRDEEGPQIIVITNKNGANGAVEAFVNKDCLKQVYDIFEGDFYILPSSVHEVLCVKKDDCMTEEELTAMVCDVNEHMLAPEEILGHHCYHVNEKLEITPPRENVLEKFQEAQKTIKQVRRL